MLSVFAFCNQQIKENEKKEKKMRKREKAMIRCMYSIPNMLERHQNKNANQTHELLYVMKTTKMNFSMDDQIFY